MSPGGQICSRKDSNLGHLMVVLEYVKEGIDFKLLTIFFRNFTGFPTDKISHMGVIKP